MFYKNKLFLSMFISHFLLILKVTAVTRTPKLTKLERETALDDYTCLAQDLLISESVLDVSVCAFKCAENETCQTMFYNQKEGECHGCMERYSVSNLPLMSPGYIHFQKEQMSCDAGWTTFQGSCYALSPAENFANGIQYCETNGAHPVYIETSEENEFLKAFLTSYASNMYWYVGMNYRIDTQEWRYYGTNELVTFFDFYTSTASNQECAWIIANFPYNFQWGVTDCTHGYPTICEKAL